MKLSDWFWTQCKADESTLVRLARALQWLVWAIGTLYIIGLAILTVLGELYDLVGAFQDVALAIIIMAAFRLLRYVVANE